MLSLGCWNVTEGKRTSWLLGQSFQVSKRVSRDPYTFAATVSDYDDDDVDVEDRKEVREGLHVYICMRVFRIYLYTIVIPCT